MPGYPKSCRGGSKLGHSWLVLALVPLALLPDSASAQLTVETRVEENFRREPQGQVLGRLGGGTSLLHVSSQGSWTEVTLEGWVWTASLQTTDREGFELVVSAAGGENVRSEPSGSILGRLDEGTLLNEVERRPGWTLVRRTGWIWSASVTTVQTSAGSTAATTSRAPAPAGQAAAPSADRFARLADRTPILSAPDGDTLALLSSAADVEVLAREGNWTRVRLDGWVWRPRSAEAEAAGADDTSTENVTPAMLTGAGGDAYEGRRVTWRLQFISLERAEAIRTDFFEGEPFILGRFGGAEGPFIYVAVPPERLTEVQGLIPLEVVTVTARVRRASSALTETPILELLGVDRGSEW
jgi:hypothetical protein